MMEEWLVCAIAVVQLGIGFGLGWYTGLSERLSLRAQLARALARLAATPEPEPEREPEPTIGAKPPEARCWAAKPADLSRYEAAKDDAKMAAFLEQRRAEEAQCELPELQDGRGREVVQMLRGGIAVNVDFIKDLPPEAWRTKADGSTLDRPLHWYRIDGKRIDCDRSTGKLVLFAEEWM